MLALPQEQSAASADLFAFVHWDCRLKAEDWPPAADLFAKAPQFKSAASAASTCLPNRIKQSADSADLMAFVHWDWRPRAEEKGGGGAP